MTLLLGKASFPVTYHPYSIFLLYRLSDRNMEDPITRPSLVILPTALKSVHRCSYGKIMDGETAHFNLKVNGYP